MTWVMLAYAMNSNEMCRWYPLHWTRLTFSIAFAYSPTPSHLTSALLLLAQTEIMRSMFCGLAAAPFWGTFKLTFNMWPCHKEHILSVSVSLSPNLCLSGVSCPPTNKSVCFTDKGTHICATRSSSPAAAVCLFVFRLCFTLDCYLLIRSRGESNSSRSLIK